jgi:peptidyl-Lys metalloendopeptidase
VSSYFTTNGGTVNYTTGQTAVKNLAISNPSKAIFNGDNHQYFAENTPTLS